MDQDPKREYHEPVMTREIVELLEPIDRGVLVDATYGGGGHSGALRMAYPRLRIVGIDRDLDVDASGDIELVRRRFSELGDVLDELGIETIDGALFDLGVSGHQFDTASRGFSYRHSGPLDMRMGPDAPFSASDVVNQWPFERLRDVIQRYGEERFAGRIARAIVERRPIENTIDLAEVVRSAVPAAARRTGGHPAKRTFQAIRMAVNDELSEIERGLEAALDRMAEGGRCVVVSYHSLEDRIIKQSFADRARGCVCPPEFPECRCGRLATFRLVTRKPLRPTPGEVERNPRARSARLRCVERIAA